MAYDARRATRDIDALFKPHGMVVEEARAVADELGLPYWWLNEQASVYVASGGDANAATIFEHRGLRVSAASPEHLLAMKLHRPVGAILTTSASSSTSSNWPTSSRWSPCVMRSSPMSRSQPGHGSCSRMSSKRATQQGKGLHVSDALVYRRRPGS